MFVKLLQFRNISHILVTFEVSKFETFMFVKLSQLENIDDIVVTFEVSNDNRLILFNDEQA